MLARRKSTKLNKSLLSAQSTFIAKFLKLVCSRLSIVKNVIIYLLQSWEYMKSTISIITKNKNQKLNNIHMAFKVALASLLSKSICDLVIFMAAFQLAYSCEPPNICQIFWRQIATRRYFVFQAGVCIL